MNEASAEKFSEEERDVETELVKCENCGSNMVFDPESQQLECVHCGSKKSFASGEIASELDITEGFDNSLEWQGEEVCCFFCDNCGAKIVLRSGEAATVCPFCNSAHAIKPEEMSGLKPNALVPFVFDEEKGLELAKTWAKKKFFAPRKFKKNITSESFKGVYAPCFTFDSFTTSYYEGRIGKTHTRTVGTGKNRRTETYVVWRNIRGTYRYNFDDLLITAGKKFDQPTLDKIAPYDTNDSKRYEENYLLGFMAYQYDEELTDCWQKAKRRIDGELKRLILSQYVHDRVAYLNVSTVHERVTYKYVMLPVYVGAFNFKKKLYNFFVNGSTGKVSGKTPKSAFKITLFIALIVAVVFALAYLLTS